MPAEAYPRAGAGVADRGDMKAENRVMRKLWSAGARLGLGLAIAAMTAPAWAAPNIIGQPVDGAITLQPGHSPQKLQAIFFHNYIIFNKELLNLITVFYCNCNP